MALGARPEHAARLRPEDGPHQLSPVALMAVAVRAGVRFREVPQEFWTAVKDDGYDGAAVECTCGQSPTVELAAAPSQCEGCERWFFLDGKRVWVLGGPGESAA